MKNYSEMYCVSTIEKLPSSDYILTIENLQNHESDCFYFDTLEAALEYYKYLFEGEKHEV